MIRYLRGIRRPEIYHGFDRRPPFFEGWYFKLVDAARGQRWAVIPGIFISDDPDKSHSFIQVLDGLTGHATYHTFPAEAFAADPYRFEVRIADNSFSGESVQLNIADGQRQISGKIQFRGCVPLVHSVYQPGIMGPFAYIPAMECYHGLLSLDHELAGTLEIDGKRHTFDGGRGYIEKDWGTNFPSAYIWMQSNHFSMPGTSLSASIARIPLWGLNFPGFIIALWHRGTHYRWATYNRSTTPRLQISDSHVTWEVTGRGMKLTLTAERHAGGLLKAPIRTEMHKRVDETMRSKVHLRLETLDGRLVLEDIGECAALEVHGELHRLVTP